uniref:cellulase n=1 Tax=Ciona savignyi TaxID=51511 RepID=H2YH69_CIOSA
YNYAEALAKSMLFYEAQRSGTLPSDQRVPWRSDSGLSDGADNNIDLAGGYYDGAGYIKYNFPMAFSTTLLSWGVIRYKRTYEALGQLDYVLDTIKWTTDYFIKCHPEPDVFYGQVSDNAADSQYFGRPEDMNYQRRSYKIDFSNSGTDLAAEAAATMASAAIVFRSSNPSYAATLQQHAVELYDFATNAPRRSYKLSIQPAAQAYGSSGFQDELAWAAAWLFKASKNKLYQNRARRHHVVSSTEFSWDVKTAGVQLMLDDFDKQDLYPRVATFCNWMLDSGPRTADGLLHLNSAYPAKYAANAAFILMLAYEKFPRAARATEWRALGIKQINYLLGDNRKGQSFVVGFGDQPPTQPLHKGSSCPLPPAECGREFREVNSPNPNVLYGALVGGPNEMDDFSDLRTLEDQSSVSLDGNAGFQAAVAGVIHLK